MKTKMMNVVVLALAFAFACFGCNDYPSPEEQMINNGEGTDTTGTSISYKERAKLTYDMIQTHYAIGDLYRENFPAQSGDNNQYSYLWPYVGMLTAGNVLFELGYDEAILNKEFGGLEAYYDSRPNLPTYQAYVTAIQSTDHYYDDSAIVAMELIDAYKNTNSPFYLERAISVAEFIMSGEDDVLGGGLYWFEGQSAGCNSGPNCIKAANTTAYASFVTAELYKLTNNPVYLNFAKRTYLWNYNTLRDPGDNLYYNSKHITTQQIDATKWTYNAAMMIMAAVDLFEITGDQLYITQATATAQSAFSEWTSVRNDRLFYPANDSWFNTELMTSYIRLTEHVPQADQYVQVFINNLDYAWDHARNSQGQFYEDWSGNNPGRYYWLLHQAALVEAYGRASLYLNEE
ncbi:glycoside hydrolase family 76 protein [Flavobacterium rhizosphaerae]|uniref:Glycoside hydrolase family 76 protein n=1 Tax=Flavobacterium rhizosphaerae TaxID=3163298 RepID=A0ABW8YZD9_9FLAO